MARTYDGFVFVKTQNGAQPATKNVPVVAGTAYHPGQVVRCVSTSGSAKRVAQTGTAVWGVLAAGIASADIAATTRLPMYIADGNNVFRSKMGFSSTPLTQMRDMVNLTVASTHNYRIQGTASTVYHCRIVGYEDFKSDNATKIAEGSAATGVQYHVVFRPGISLDGTGSTTY